MLFRSSLNASSAILCALCASTDLEGSPLEVKCFDLSSSKNSNECDKSFEIHCTAYEDFLVLSLFLTLGHGKKSDDQDHCCPGSITLGATGAAAAKWAQYLGQYKPTKQKHEGAPVYQNQNSKFLYLHKKGQWRINNVINERGVFKGVSSWKAACVSPNSKWYFWDEE